MKINDFDKTIREHFPKNGEWLIRCSRNACTAWCKDQWKKISQLWKEAASLDEFLHNLKVSAELKYDSQAYAEFGKTLGWRVPIKSDQCECLHYCCDGGSIMIGDLAGTCAFKISNGYGDGDFPIVISKRESYWAPHHVNTDMMDFQGVIKGAFQIYHYDCAELKKADEKSLIIDEGEWFVFSKNGLIVLENHS